jgi:hypothetical protein
MTDRARAQTGFSSHSSLIVGLGLVHGFRSADAVPQPRYFWPVPRILSFIALLRMPHRAIRAR